MKEVILKLIDNMWEIIGATLLVVVILFILAPIFYSLKASGKVDYCYVESMYPCGAALKGHIEWRTDRVYSMLFIG